MVPLSAQEAADVAAILAQQRVGLVFRMTLEIDKQRRAPVFANERIDTDGIRAAETLYPPATKVASGKSLMRE